METEQEAIERAERNKRATRDTLGEILDTLSFDDMCAVLEKAVEIQCAAQIRFMATRAGRPGENGFTARRAGASAPHKGEL